MIGLNWCLLFPILFLEIHGKNMSHFYTNKDGLVCAENLPVAALAKEYGTPLYIYSRTALEEQFNSFSAAAQDISHLICYAVKANSNLAILALMAKLGAGFDIVSGGELARVIEAGGDPHKVVYSGVAKSVKEMEFALNAGIMCFNVESEAEMERLNEVAGKLGQKAPVSIRVNPDVDAGTHPYISTGLKTNKFGVPIERAFDLYVKTAKEYANLEIHGIDCHIGSQLTSLTPFSDSLDRILKLVDRLQAAGITLHHIDVGGGLGVVHNDETPPSPRDYINNFKQALAGRGLMLVCEPGRSMVANAGVLVAKCEYVKKGEVRDFCIVDTAMNDMIRPSLYSAWMKIEEADQTLNRPSALYDVVGPICETGDFLGKERELKVASGDYLVMHGAGAYGFSMASNYNSRPRACEIMVKDTKAVVIREREEIADIWRHERKELD